MGFLKRLLSIGRSRDKKSDRERQTPVLTVPEHGSDNQNHQRRQRQRQPMPVPSSSSSLQPPPHERHRQRSHSPTPSMQTVNEEESEMAVSRLLRSASAHFKVVSETNYDALPPISHPINSISSRNTAAGSSSNANTIQHKGSYKVKVHPRQQISKTEFPNAYPPQTPRVSIYKSTPNLLQDTSTAPTRRRQASAGRSNPRKVPFTPRDINRLSRLRQDPSVATLLSMYDEKGQLDVTAFSNTPRATSCVLDGNRRESTFRQLLGESEASDADLSWAERCVAESNASTSSLSTAPSTNTPDTLNFKDIKAVDDRTAILSDPTENDEAISSMVVELSMTTDRGLHSFPSSTATSIIIDPEPKESFERKPSLRASQVFNFINERRARRKSEGTEVILNTGDLSRKHSAPLSSLRPTHTQNRSQNSSPFGTPDSLENEFQSVEQLINATPASQLSSRDLTVPAPDSPMLFHPLNPALRTRASSTGAADALRACELPKPRPSRRRVGGSAGADDTLCITRDELLQRQAEIEREWRMAPQSTPHAKAHRSSRNRKTSDTISQTKRTTIKNYERQPLTVRTNGYSRASMYEQDADTPKATGHARSRSDRDVTHERNSSIRSSQYETFVANMKHNKENGGWTKKTAAPDLGRAVTTSYFTQSKALPTLPLTPSRTRSLAEPTSPVSSSELSPEAAQLMANARSRKMRTRHGQRIQENLMSVR